MVAKDARAIIKIPTSTIVKLLAAAVWDGLRGALGLSPFYVKVYGKPGDLAVFSDPALAPRFEAVEKGSATWRNEFTPRFYLAPPRYREGMAERIKMPLLVGIAEQEVYANPTFQARVAKAAPRSEVKWYPGQHFDFYHDLFEPVVADQVAFLSTHLRPGP
jgi:hypothetical protein